jgi:hypothetical protein
MSTLTRDSSVSPKRRGRPPGSTSANARAQDRRDATRAEADEATPNRFEAARPRRYAGA